ncbi:antitoxin [Candidatus Electronema sp. PJ]|uniref:antitoxin n=1 Tax=Candidatus Electronema sp. PJ TaxID=3401572 RepID=UPI003AA7B6B3
MEIAKIFRHDGRQAIQLPADFHLDSDDIFIWRDKEKGNIVLSPHPNVWDDFLLLRDRLLSVHQEEIASFLSKNQMSEASNDPFAEWQE